jgi:hypothetical protein
MIVLEPTSEHYLLSCSYRREEEEEEEEEEIAHVNSRRRRREVNVGRELVLNKGGI